MNDERLKEKLARLPVPEPDPVARSRALARAQTALELGGRAAPAARERRAWPWLLPAGCALVILFHLFPWPIPWAGTPDRALLADLVVFEQMSALFSHRLEAVVEHRGKVDVQLSPEDVPLSQQPIRIVLSRGNDVVRVLSFSGREVCLDLGGRRTCLDVLATNDGGVILAGGTFFWNRQNPASLAGYRVEAAALPPAS